MRQGALVGRRDGILRHVAPATHLPLAAHGTVIYLRASIDDLLLRTQNDKNRPLLQTADPRAKLESLFAQRDPLYREVADIIIDTSRQNVHLLVSRLLQKLAHHSPCPSTPLPGASPHDHA